MNSAATIAEKNNKYGTPLLLALVAAGLAGNYFKFPIFLNIDFIFGSIFAMLALQLYGLGRGTLAAALIAGYTYFIWNHPYAIIIMSTEVAVVGWLTGRRKVGLVVADALYWFLLGLPLAFLFYHLVMDVSLSNTYIVMTKQAVNGMANALIARLIFTWFMLGLRSSLIPFREIVCNLLAFFVLCPALIMLAIGSRSDFNEAELHIRNTLDQHRQQATQNLQAWLRNRKSATLNLAELAASRSPQQMQDMLEHTYKSDGNFLRIGLLDRKALTTAYVPLHNEPGQITIGRSFADRPYIPQLQQSLKPMLSEVVMGRIGSPAPVIQMLAPVVIDSQYAGYVSGIIDLEQIHDYFRQLTNERSTLYSLIDKNGNIIMSNRRDQTIMTPFLREPGTSHPLDKGISQWIPDLTANVPISERWKKSFYVAEATIGDLAEWQLILEEPVAPFQRALYANYTGKLIQLLIILFVALALAELLSRGIMRALEALTALTEWLPHKPGADGKPIVWPHSRVEETHHLITNFRKMVVALIQQFDKVHEINQSLEQQMNALRESDNFTHAILNSVAGQIAVLDRNGVILAVNEPWQRFAHENGVEPGSPASGTGVGANYLAICQTDAALASDDAQKTHDGILAVLEGSLPSFSIEYPCHSPMEQRWFHMGVIPLIGAAQGGVVITHTNITERKQVAVELRRMSAQLTMTEERERRMLAQELHDNLCQLLAVIKIKLTSLVAGALQASINQIVVLVDQADLSARTINRQLSPPALLTQGLLPALELLAEDLEHTYKLTVLINVETAPLPLVDEVQAVLYRSIRELLINVAKHAGVSEASLSLIGDKNQLLLLISDDGCGFDPATLHDTVLRQHSFGLSSIYHRLINLGGEMEIDSEPGNGTTVTLSVPYSLAAKEYQVP